MTDLELAWLAGLLEGEGCFSVQEQERPSGKVYYQAKIRCSMTDEDIIRRLHELVPQANVYERRFDLMNEKWKKQWSWELCKKQDCIDLAKLLYPFMGIRRRIAIDKILQLEKQCAS